MSESSDLFQLRNLLVRSRLAQLVSACRFFNLKKSGAKPEVLERLLTFLVTASIEERDSLSIALTYANTATDQHNMSAPSTRSGSIVESSFSYDRERLINSKEVTSRMLEERSCDLDTLMEIFENIDPFHPVAPVACPYLLLFNCKSGSTNFSLDLPELKSLRRQGFSVWLRCASTGAGKHDRHVWPREIRVFLNMSQVFKVEEPKKLKKRRDEPVDLTVFFHSGKNQLQLSISDINPRKFTVALMVCGSLGDNAIVSSTSSQSADESKTRLIEILRRIDCDYLVEESNSGFVSLDLRCPISLEKLKSPARGKSCDHLRCFDLNSFVSVNRQTSNINLRWMCPICQRLLLPKDLVIDDYIGEIINTSPDSTLSVLLNRLSGEWKLDEIISSEMYAHQEESETGRPEADECPEEAILRKEILIELIDDSSGDPSDSPAPKRNRTEEPLLSGGLEVIELD